MEKEREELLAEAALLRKRLRELTRERDFLAALVEASSDEIWFCDPDETVRPVNKAARSFLACAESGSPSQEQIAFKTPAQASAQVNCAYACAAASHADAWLAEHFQKQNALTLDEVNASPRIVGPDGSPRPSAGSSMRHALAGESGHWTELMRHPGTGELRQREYRANPIRDERGVVTGAVAIARDVTQARRTEAALRESDERLRIALAHAPVTVFAQDADLRFTWIFNPPFGLGAEDIVGRTIRDFIKPEDVPGVQALAEKLLASGRAVRQELEIRVMGRETCWDVTIEPRRDGRGEICGTIGAAYDMTDRRRSEKALEESNERCRRIFHLSPAILSLTTFEDGVYLDVNEAFTRLLGYEREEVIGRRALDLWIWLEPHQYRQIAAKLRESGSLRSRLVKFRTRSGEVKTLVISAELMDIDGRQCVLAAASDFTSQQRRLDTLRRRDAEYRAILENTSDIIARVDRDSRFAYLNQAVTRVTGLLPRAIVGKGLHELGLSREALEKARAALRSVLDSARPQVFEASSPMRGRALTLQVCLVPELSRSGEVETVLAIGRDITALKKTEDELRRSREHYRLLYESVPLGYQSLDAQGCFVEVNRAWLETMGYAREEVLGQWFGRFVTAESAARLDESFRGFKRSGEMNGGEFEMVRKDGTCFIAAFYGKIRTDGQGRFRQTHCIMHDITARKQAEQEIRRARDEAEAASRVKSTFLAHMSHELRTPLNGVLGMVELAHMASSNEKPREYLRLARQSGHMLLDIINDILDLSKIEAGKAGLKLEPFSLREVVDSTLEPLAMPGRRKGLAVSWYMDPWIPDRLAGDQSRLRQVLANLVGNAIKFTEQGSVSVDLGLSEEDCPAGHVRLACFIADTGPGIPRDKLADLFEPFAQALSPEHVKYGGTGLGLAISKRLVEMMQGAIRADSVPGRGSTFRFTAVFRVPDERAAPRASGPCEPALQCRPLRILVAEDNAVNQVLARDLLGLEGHAADVVGTGREALQALRRAGYDLVLMDIRMPDMDGLEAVRRIRAGEAGDPRIPVIALTAYALDGDRERFLAAGMDGYLAKPIRIEDLKALLRDVADRGCG